MAPLRPPIAVLFAAALLFYGASSSTATAVVSEPVTVETGVATLEDGTTIQWEASHGATGLAALRYLFTNTFVEVHCPGRKDLAVFTGHGMPEVREAYARGDRAWCGWDHFIGHSPDTCLTPVSPRGTTYVAVATPKSWFDGGNDVQCSLHRLEEFSMPRFLAAVLGAFLFWSAPALSESTPFRLTGGTLGIMLTSVLLVAYFLSRSMPHKRSLAAVTTLFSGSVAAAARFAFGTWFPSVRQLLTSPLVAAYLVLSGLVGMAVTYYYNDTTNQRLNTILKVALQLVGLSALASSGTLPEGRALLVAAAVGSKLMESQFGAPPARRGVKGMAAAATHAVSALTHQLSPGSHPRVTVSTARPAANITATAAHPHVDAAPIPRWLAEAPAAPMATTPRAPVHAAVPAVSPLVERGMVLNEDTGRLIHIGKPTYNKLLKEGYTVDKGEGTITPPPVRRSGAGGAGGSGSGKKVGRPVGSGKKKST